VKGGFFLDVVISEGSVVLELLSSIDESLLVERDFLFDLDPSLDVFNGFG
jgi:hypothetical protein